MRLTTFAKYAWGVLFFNIFVILWGAVVRATGSGAGCGSHWPLCNGEVIPLAPRIETIVEFVHRLSSGLAFLLVLGLFLWSLRAFPKGNKIRFAAGLSFLFIITEALIGAGLVLFRWVAQDTSVARAFAIVFHLINTFILLASLVLTAWLSSGAKRAEFPGKRMIKIFLALGLVGTIILGASGALTALGDTLFPSGSLSEGLQQDFLPTAHFLIRLRVLHPTIAIIVGVYLITMAGILRLQEDDPDTLRIARLLTLGILLQLGVGFLNLFLLAPVWMQIVHLFFADLVWIILVLLFYSSLGLSYNTRL